MFLDYAALAIMVFAALVCFYLIIAIHDIPYEIAKHRNHPHQDAIHVAGWVSLLTLHVIWPFLWIWATLYKPGRGYGFASDGAGNTSPITDRLAAIETRLQSLEAHATVAPATRTEQSANKPFAGTEG